MMPYSETEVIESQRCYFDKHIYTELNSFIYGDFLLSHSITGQKDIPTFESVVEKVNSFQLNQDCRCRIISETLGQLLSDLYQAPEIPSFLLDYLCRETVRNATLRKFNHQFGYEFIDLQSLSKQIGDNIAEANKVFNTIRICDPAVHSGIFLQTILNEMIAVKSQIGALMDKYGNPLHPYRIVAENGRLSVFNKEDFRCIPFDGSTAESCYVQEALYHEKVALMHHCLFGVDAEPEWVLHSKLRLWLDIIIHMEGVTCTELPAIESNIICGDALLSRFTLNEDIFVALKLINQTVSDYKRLSEKIKTVTVSSDRQYLKELMVVVKNRIVEGIGWNSEDTDELQRLQSELAKIMAPSLFPFSEREKYLHNERITLLQSMIVSQEQHISKDRNHPAFASAVEWRYVFPELLDDRGNFVGFDAMVGLLPDVGLSEIDSETADFYKRMNYKVYKSTENISDLFCELTNRLLVYGGYMTYLMPSNWRLEISNNKTGNFLMTEMNPLQLLLFDDISTTFDSLKNKCAIIVQKDVNRYHTVSCRLDSSVIELGDYVRQYAKPENRLVETEKTFEKESIHIDIVPNKAYRSIHDKILQKGVLIKNWNVCFHSGITTGYNEAFVVDKTVRDELIHFDYKNSEILKPLLSGDYIKRYGDKLPDQWLLTIPWHFPMHYDKTINSASKRAEQRFQAQYPDVYAHLLKYREELSSRYTNEVGLKFEWYALQQSVVNINWDCFSGQKIVWKRNTLDYCFGIDFGGCVVLDNVCFMTGQHLKFLLGVFNSTMGRYILTERLQRLVANKYQASIFAVETMPVPIPGQKMESDVISLVNRRISENDKSDEMKAHTEEKIDCLIYELYDLTENEIAFVKTTLPYSRLKHPL